MTQWLKPRARHACIFGALLAVLMGCNEGGNEPPPKSTFAIAEPIDDSKVPPEPVIGIVTEVPDTEQKKPETDGGKAIPLVDPESQIVPLVPAKATRFTEIAPDTIGGATFAASSAYDYDLGNLVAKVSSSDITFADSRILITPIKGWIRYPNGAESSPASVRYPVVVFLHGQHTDSATSRSYQGYDYLAKELAAHGYVVLSIDASRINEEMLTASFGMFVSPGGDVSGQSRAQLLLGTLDRLRQIDENGQIGADGKPGALGNLKGKLDFGRIGIMGHSRGGKGVSNAILFNKSRRGVTEADFKAAMLATKLPDFLTPFPDLTAAVTPRAGSTPARIDDTKFTAAIEKFNIFFAAGSGNAMVPPPYAFKGALMVAPVSDAGGSPGLNDVPLANLLPSCDGDVSQLDGARVYDRNRFGTETDSAPRYQILVQGGNHNFYNKEWSQDENPSPTGYCGYDRKGAFRLNADDQRRNGLFIMNSFLRYHVGGEQKFANYWNGTAQLPDAACPAGKGPCDKSMVLTVQKNGGRNKLIQRFDKTDSLERNALGLTVTFAGFEGGAPVRCDMPQGDVTTVGTCTPNRLDGFAYGASTTQGLRSIADHVELAWSKKDASVVEDITALSAKGYDSLTFRIAVVRPMGQEVLVTLTDSTGHAWTVTASDFSDALYNAPRRKKGGDVPADKDLPMVDDADDANYSSGQVKILMSMVAIPLKAFEGVDANNLKELKLVFPKESGKVAITDIELQNLGRDKPQQKLAAKQ
jgi:hypothetical protein